jgi:hypothetical protein
VLFSCSLDKPSEVSNCTFEDEDVVPSHTYGLVAPVAQQSSELPGLLVVVRSKIKDPAVPFDALRLFANGTSTTLLVQGLLVLFFGNAALLLSVALGSYSGATFSAATFQAAIIYQTEEDLRGRFWHTTPCTYLFLRH